MLKKILVAIDDLERDREVFDEALAIAQTQEASLLLLHILPGEDQTNLFPPTLMGYGTPLLVETTIERFRQDWKALENHGLSMLQDIAAKAKANGAPCEFIQLAGSPAPIICEIARDWDVDLVVMGRRGFSGLAEVFIGSVSNYALHHAPCSVLVVQNKRIQKPNDATQNVVPLQPKS
ncbi:universal stress protein [Vacuolonema iberomarrocanum]|uniref:universal stress protein n=1 Tax=Vacuolonema iberomarrocanum TaxID=3454632 RepID=UPI0019D86A53|nr:universal stress protein [filamentous cyanobacterium LEGE 07170]